MTDLKMRLQRFAVFVGGAALITAFVFIGGGLEAVWAWPMLLVAAFVGGACYAIWEVGA